MKKYKVTYQTSRTYEAYVWADDEDAAVQAVMDNPSSVTEGAYEADGEVPDVHGITVRETESPEEAFSADLGDYTDEDPDDFSVEDLV